MYLELKYFGGISAATTQGGTKVWLLRRGGMRILAGKFSAPPTSH
jgi:hypothetical protein